MIFSSINCFEKSTTRSPVFAVIFEARSGSDANSRFNDAGISEASNRFHSDVLSRASTKATLVDGVQDDMKSG